MGLFNRKRREAEKHMGPSIKVTAQPQHNGELAGEGDGNLQNSRHTGI